MGNASALRRPPPPPTTQWFVTFSVTSFTRTYTQADCPSLSGPPLNYFYPTRVTYMNQVCNQLTVFNVGFNSSTLSLTLYFSSNSTDIYYMVRIWPTQHACGQSCSATETAGPKRTCAACSESLRPVFACPALPCAAQYQSMLPQQNWRMLIQAVNPGCGFVASYVDSQLNGNYTVATWQNATTPSPLYTFDDIRVSDGGCKACLPLRSAAKKEGA